MPVGPKAHCVQRTCRSASGISRASARHETLLVVVVGLGVYVQTRFDLAIYVNALQRHAQAPQMIHIRRLNALVRWAQRHPLPLVYQHMQPSGILEVHSDADFRREEDDPSHPIGRSTRGANLVRLGTSQQFTECCHLLEWTSSHAVHVFPSCRLLSQPQIALSCLR